MIIHQSFWKELLVMVESRPESNLLIFRALLRVNISLY